MEIFRTGFRQSRTVLRFGFDPGTDVFGFCCVFWYHSDSVTNGTKKWFIAVKDQEVPCFYGFEIEAILCVIDWCLNNMLLCEKFMLI